MVIVLLLPLIFAMHFHPRRDVGEAAIFALSGQIEWGLIGLGGTVLAMGIVTSFFILATSTLSRAPDATRGANP